MPFDLQPVLNGELLDLRPLRAKDFNDLYAVAADPLLWEQHPIKDRYKGGPPRPFLERLCNPEVFVVIDANDGQVVIGSFP